MNARIDSKGIWIRRVPKRWARKGIGRTDIPKSVLSNPRLRQCNFDFQDGPFVIIPPSELRRILEGGREHYGGRIWGPFNLNTKTESIDGQKAKMLVLGM